VSGVGALSSVDPRLISRVVITYQVKLTQPTWPQTPQYVNVNRQTDRRTDNVQSQYRAVYAVGGSRGKNLYDNENCGVTEMSRNYLLLWIHLTDG